MEQIIKRSVHLVLAQSYLVFFVLCSFGLFLDMVFPFLIPLPHSKIFAVFCFAAGPLLILWAQYTSYRFERTKEKTGEIIFNKGPYAYIRNPTQFGLVILVGGYAFASHAAMLFITSGISYIISNFFFKKHEAILDARYGDSYKDYKSSVPKVM
jgi:protein-S-isoprenylcysteine O-methyltransferase Ste14